MAATTICPTVNINRAVRLVAAYEFIQYELNKENQAGARFSFNNTE